MLRLEVGFLFLIWGGEFALRKMLDIFLTLKTDSGWIEKEFKIIDGPFLISFHIMFTLQGLKTIDFQLKNVML